MMIVTLLLMLSNGHDNEDNHDKYLFLSVVLVECDQVLVTQIVIGGKEGSECFLNFTIYLMNLIIIHVHCTNLKSLDVFYSGTWFVLHVPTRAHGTLHIIDQFF